jgi:hypothetical protein
VVGVVAAIAGCAPDTAIVWEPERRVPGAMAPGITLVISEGGVPAARPFLAPLRWPDDSLACATTRAAVRGRGDTLVAAWWRADSLVPAVLRVAVSPNGGIDWSAASDIGVAAPRTRGCGRPAPGIGIDTTDGRIAVAFHGTARDTAGVLVRTAVLPSLAPLDLRIAAVGGAPRSAAVAIAAGAGAVAFESPAEADGAVWLALLPGSGHIPAKPERVTQDGARAFAPAVAVHDRTIAVAWNEAARGGNGPAAVVRVGRATP